MGYGMWGLAGWTGADDKEIDASLHKAVELGCNFFDTAWGYGAQLSDPDGHKLYVWDDASMKAKG